MTDDSQPGRFAGKIALVTGASRGLGRATALRLAAGGAHVIAVARTVGGLEELDDEIQAAGGSATLVPLDFTAPAGIDGLAAPLAERWGRLDILVGNAAILGRLTPTQQIPPDLFQKAMDVNVTANWRLIRALDPLLRAAPQGRAVFVTSGATRSLPAYWATYTASKAALEALVLTYAQEVEKTNLRVNLFNPGPMRTGMRALAFPGEDPKRVPPPESLAEGLVSLLTDECRLHGAWVAGDQEVPAAAARH
ncbi:MAG: SDR family NAD(P)-dependent oxidoreductase [Sneathiellaceae bacterium]